jgi:hypothetical protein
LAPRFNPPPGWPAPPSDEWLPPPGWSPDAEWPPAPAGWQLIIDAAPITSVGARTVLDPKLPAGATFVDPVTLDIMSRFSQTKELTCLECGYRGMMGVVKQVRPVWLSWPALVAIGLVLILLVPMTFGASLLLGAILGFIVVVHQKATCICPNCRRVIHEK